ncbi:1,4-alpha-glucan branching protein GlgB [soil metagenome]
MASSKKTSTASKAKTKPKPKPAPRSQPKSALRSKPKAKAAVKAKPAVKAKAAAPRAKVVTLPKKKKPAVRAVAKIPVKPPARVVAKAPAKAAARVVAKPSAKPAVRAVAKPAAKRSAMAKLPAKLSAVKKIPAKPVASPPAVDWPELADGVQLSEFDTLIHCTCYDPHRLLGCHPATVNGRAGLIVRAWHPDAEKVELIVESHQLRVPLRALPKHGVFGIWLEGFAFPFSYKLRFSFANAADWTTPDPYAFMPSLSDLDIYLHSEGNHYRAYRKFGAQVREVDGAKGVSFCVWAPAAKRVSVIGEFNNWDGRLNPMRSMGGSGVWELFIPGVVHGMGYKYEILTQDRNLRYKADPYSFGFDLRPSTHSKVIDLSLHEWADADYMAELSHRRHLDEPMAVYEVHLGSWMRLPDEGNRWLTYRELAATLIPHVQKYNFTHIELLPIAEHPFDGSWGYQVTGYYAVTSRFGSPEDFKFFVDECHRHGIGVIVDWVPAHFPRDDFALRRFDGSALYEYEDPRRGEHKDWGTLIFNYGRPEVKNFLLSNALFWLDEYHIDGLRVDAVASMLYLDYSREAGQWIPNEFGGNENLEAIAFLRQLNEVVHAEYPGRFTLAEESTSFPGVSKPTYSGGLGFTFKWNMGWMNDTLRYFAKDPLFRKFHQNDLTFALIYQYTENFMLPMSHDEVVHGKGSLVAKMPGDWWQKFANLRLLYAYMYAHPGKKLLFMGAEFGQYGEWQYDRSLDWHQAGEKLNKGIEHCLAALGAAYRNNREFWIFDNDPIGFRWITADDSDSSIISFLRQGPEGVVICVFNFTPVPRFGYLVGVPKPGRYDEIFNSDAEEFGGGNVGNYGQTWSQDTPWHGQSDSLHINVPPLGAVFLKSDR